MLTAGTILLFLLYTFGLEKLTFWNNSFYPSCLLDMLTSILLFLHCHDYIRCMLQITRSLVKISPLFILTASPPTNRSEILVENFCKFGTYLSLMTSIRFLVSCSNWQPTVLHAVPLHFEVCTCIIISVEYFETERD